jgi:hypothetical protein
MAGAAAWPVTTEANETEGGLVAGAQLVHVRSLADEGPDTLRSALMQSGPRVILFDVGGRIVLRSPLTVLDPQVTIAGETAPSPGIELFGDTLQIRASDVVVRHIAVRPGAADKGSSDPDRDGINVGGKDRSSVRPSRVVIDHVSVAWAVDENIGIWGDEGPHGHTSEVSVRNSLIAEGLQNAGADPDKAAHTKGLHSKGLLVGSGVRDVRIVGNLFVSNFDRNPRFGPDVSGEIVGNAIGNPGESAIEVNFRCQGISPAKVLVGGNAMRPGVNTKRGLPLLRVVDRVGEKGATEMSAASRAGCHGLNEVLTVQPDAAEQLFMDRVSNVGSRPADRDRIDRAIVGDFETGVTMVRDRIRTVNADPTGRVPTFIEPADLSERAKLDASEIEELRTALCERRSMVGENFVGFGSECARN